MLGVPRSRRLNITSASLGHPSIWNTNAAPAKNLQELIAWLKANPGKVSQGSGGTGSAAHIQGVFFQMETGTRFQHVPYRGAGPAMQDLVAGQIELMIDQVPNSLPQVQAGKIRAYAVTASRRLAAAKYMWCSRWKAARRSKLGFIRGM